MDLNYLIHTCKYKRAEITKTKNSIDLNITTYSKEYKEELISRLLIIQNEIRQLNEFISLELYNKEASAAETQHEYDACVEYI